jgi:Mrp family chromosome partitioning ATPase
MSQVYQSRGVDSDRIDGDRRTWRAMTVLLVLGLIIGGGLGGFYGKSRPASYVATVALSVLPDSAVSAQQVQGSPTIDATSFIQGQLVVLNDSQIAAQVQQQLKLVSRPAISAKQVGQSYVVQVTGTAGVRTEALDVATAAATTYAKQRAQQLAASINASIKSIAQQVSDTQKKLTAAERLTPTITALTPTETALQTTYEQLLSQSSSFKLALPQVNKVVTVLSPASINGSSLSATTKYGLAGALLGALAGLALLILVRRVTPRVRSLGDVAALGVPVLLPVLGRRSARSRRGAAGWRSSGGRLLAARLTGHAANAQPVIIVGATSGVGTSFVAASVAAGLAERGPVLLVLAAELVSGPRSRELMGSSLPSTAGLAPSNYAEVDDLIHRARRTVIGGVWMLPFGAEFPELSEALPSSRPALLADILHRATAAGWLVVVDAPALSESDLALECAASSGVTTLVVGRGVSRAADVLSASELFDANNIPFAGVILNDVPGKLRRRHSAQSLQAQAAGARVEPPQQSDRTPQRGRRRAAASGRSARSMSETVPLSELVSSDVVTGGAGAQHDRRA